MLFLLHIQTHPRPELTSEQRTEFRERESAAAVDLMRRGILRRMFRCVGSNLSYSIWEADTPEQLHAGICTLPAFPSILHVTVTPLIRHPVEDAYERAYGPIPPL